jgi:hypothetical protein
VLKPGGIRELAARMEDELAWNGKRQRRVMHASVTVAMFVEALEALFKEACSTPFSFLVR